MDWMAKSSRSVLSELYSVSSAAKEVVSSAVPSVEPVCRRRRSRCLRCRCTCRRPGAGRLVGGEVLVHGEAGGQADDGDEVGRLHLLVDVVLGGLDGAVDVFGLHGAEVEEDDDEAVVAQVLRGGAEAGVRAGRAMVGLAGDGVLFGEDGGCVDALEVEAGDLLRLVVFEDGEVGGFEVPGRRRRFSCRGR